MKGSDVIKDVPERGWGGGRLEHITINWAACGPAKNLLTSVTFPSDPICLTSSSSWISHSTASFGFTYRILWQTYLRKSEIQR